MTRFSTGDDKGEKHVGDDYFLNSNDKVRFFFEEGSLPKRSILHYIYALTNSYIAQWFFLKKKKDS